MNKPKFTSLILITVTIFLFFSLVASEDTAEGEAVNLTDVISFAENIRQNFEKLDIKSEIDGLDANISELKEENEELTSRINNLQNRINHTQEAIRVISGANEDSMFKWASMFFFFFLGAFISSLLFIKVIWKIKIEGED